MSEQTGMKMSKVTPKDIDAAGDAMSILECISHGYYPQKEGDADAPMYFDDEDPDHLSHFYQRMKATLDHAPGWPGRVIGGMCFVIMYAKNEIVDPDADTLELHPKFAKVATDLETAKADREELLKTLQHIRQRAVLDSRDERIVDAAISKATEPKSGDEVPA